MTREEIESMLNALENINDSLAVFMLAQAQHIPQQTVEKIIACQDTFLALASQFRGYRAIESFMNGRDISDICEREYHSVCYSRKCICSCHGGYS